MEHNNIDAIPDIPVFYLEKDSQPAHGHLVEVKGDHLVVNFPTLKESVGHPGATGALRVSIDGRRYECGEIAIWDRIARGDGGACLGAQFQKWPALNLSWPLAIRSLFNRRRAFRVTPAPGSPIAAHILASRPTCRLRGVLQSISLTGVALSLSPDQTQLVELLPPSVKVHLRLPRVRGDVSLRARIIHQLAEPDSVTVGTAFVDLETNTRDYHRILRYIMRRQQEELRRED